MCHLAHGIGRPRRPFAATMRPLLTTFAALFFAALGLAGASHLAVSRVADRVFDDPAEVPSRPVVIVPGAGLRADGTPHGYLEQRLECALGLFASGKARHILVSGDNCDASYDEASSMRQWLIGRGVPDAAITRDFAGFRTRDTMERAARVFGVTGAIVCTQGLHAERSVFLARDAGIDAVALVARGDHWFGFGARLRERIATVAAVVDAMVDTQPRFLGPRLPIAADATP